MTGGVLVSLFLTAMFWLFVVGIGIAAFRLGGREERRVFLLLLFTVFASVAVRIAGREDFEAISLGVFIADLVLLAVLVWVVARSPRYFPIWTMAFHLSAVLSHLARLATPDLPPVAYALGEGFWGYPVFATILIGCAEVRLLRRMNLPIP
ncbi:hypothetical protein B5C34_14500 [Pacificimonas flava]|uniref:Uncharacterized protein n=2 Tax=Pacificimonas TaxID=1960290 RepID=A0A219B2E9_9SPHN|nr:MULTISPECIES: hypothetical protein [Pacificimonas]MBZ6380101.1 hypothetical protein [Pacificimonas aurantium]OWV31979.1 hypothetical protein B5C34_14500 [Pacificimonas flava]